MKHWKKCSKYEKEDKTREAGKDENGVVVLRFKECCAMYNA